MARSGTDVALFLGGGGARAAYQAGVLRALADRVPGFDPSILTGVSAGAINIGWLANHRGDVRTRAQELVDLWARIDVDDVFEARGWPLLRHAACVLLKMVTGWDPSRTPVRALADARPLHGFLRDAYGDDDLPGIRANLASGRLNAVALLALRYATGQTISFCAGESFRDWDRPMRRSRRTDLRLDHVIASCSLPLFFQPVEVDGDWFGDGGVRLVAPLAPAIHLGARRVLAISTRHRPDSAEAEQRRIEGHPTPAVIAGNLFAAVFLDALDHDAMQLERINRLVRAAPAEAHGPLRDVRLVVVRPSEDLGRLANEFEARLPGFLRFLTRRWGTRKARSQELLSTILFQADYVRHLLEIGERDGAARADDVAELVAN